MKRFAVLICLFLLWGCAAGIDYGHLARQMDAGDCQGALDLLEGQRYGANQELLYLMDAGMLNMRCENHGAAVDYFNRADDLARDLWTLSVSREAASFFWNDYTRAYRGEDFERAMIHLMAAISYIEMGDRDAALVSFRRLDSLLRELNDRYEKKNVYNEDAFARYLSGILYEADGSLDDAFIAYFRAYEIYRDYEKHYGTPAPSTLVEDLRRTGIMVDRIDDLTKLGIDPNASFEDHHGAGSGYGKVVFIAFRGNAPKKVENAIIIPAASGPLKFSFPHYVVQRPTPGRKMIILESTENRYNVETYLVQDINRIAVKNLHDREGRVMARMMARSLAKQVLIDRAARETGIDALRIGMNIANLFVERADTRSWRTLPGEIHLARVFVPAGSYIVNTVSGYGGETGLEKVDVKAGETEFVFQMM